MQELLDSTRALSASFSERVATASAESADKHASAPAELTARDAQLMEHIGTAQRNNSAAFKLLTAQLTTLSDSKQAELQHKVDEVVSAMQGQFHTSARGLYDQAVAEARSHFGSSRQDRGKDAGKGGARERPFFDAGDYKIPNLPSAPSIVVFKKWRHDLELFLATIGSSWKGVTAVLRTSRLFEKGRLREMEALTLKREPKAATLEYGFDF